MILPYRLGLVLASFTACQAGVLISFGDGNPLGGVGWDLSGDLTSAAASSWTQTVTTANTSITVAVDAYSGAGSGTAWLMTAIGPGTTTYSQIGQSLFVPPSIDPNDLDTQPQTIVFSDLTLAPGTYYLVLTGPTDQAPGTADYIWWRDEYPIPHLASGFTRGSDFATNS